MLRTIIVLVAIVGSVCSWKPIASPTSFSINQHHPSLGHNTISDTSGSGDAYSGGTGSAHSSSSITYHGNSFLNDHSLDHDESESDSEPRILHHKNTIFGNNYYNALVPTAVSVHLIFHSKRNPLKINFKFFTSCFVLNFPLKKNVLTYSMEI